MIDGAAFIPFKGYKLRFWKNSPKISVAVTLCNIESRTFGKKYIFPMIKTETLL